MTLVWKWSEKNMGESTSCIGWHLNKYYKRFLNCLGISFFIVGIWNLGNTYNNLRSVK